MSGRPWLRCLQGNVILYYREEMALRDIAQALGVTTGTVKTLLFRARRHLRDRLEAANTIQETRR
jgi:DNA-directed RNA polymerase specialized sigma24 family protein